MKILPSNRKCNRVAGCVSGVVVEEILPDICRFRKNHYIRTVKPKKEEIMEDIKKKPLGDEELELVTGGASHVVYRGDNFSLNSYWLCDRCGVRFYTEEEAEAHEATCTGERKPSGTTKPLII